MNLRWEPWRSFPNPLHGDYVTGPFSSGVSWIRHRGGECVHIGASQHVVAWLTSLLPSPLGEETRENKALREYVLANSGDLEYRTAACLSKQGASILAARLFAENPCRFDVVTAREQGPPAE